MKAPPVTRRKRGERVVKKKDNSSSFHSQRVWDTIDFATGPEAMTKEDATLFLQDVIEGCKSRIEALRDEIANELGEED